MTNLKIELRNLRLMVLGILISKTGSVAFTFAVGLYVLGVTGSAMKLGISVLLFTVPRLIFTPIAGVLADNFNRKYIVVFGDIISGLIVLCGLLMPKPSITLVYIIVVLLSSVQSFFEVAFQAAQPDIVSDEKLFKLNAYSQSAMSATNIVGFVLSGILLSFGIKFVILVNGVSFILSGISEWFIDFSFNKKAAPLKTTEKQSFTEQYKTSMAVFKQKPIIGYVVSLSLAANFFIALSVSVPLVYMMNRMLGISETYLGIINGVLSAGIFVSSMVLAKRKVHNLYKNSFLFAVIVGMTLVFMGLPFILSTTYAVPFSIAILAVLHFIAGYSVPAFSVPIITLEQQFIPPELRGKVFGLINLASEIGRPIAILISSLLIPTVLPMHILMFSGVMIILVTVIVMTSPVVKVAFAENQMKQTAETGE